MENSLSWSAFVSISHEMFLVASSQLIFLVVVVVFSLSYCLEIKLNCFFFFLFVYFLFNVCYFKLKPLRNVPRTVATCCRIWITSMRHVLAFGAGDMAVTLQRWYSAHSSTSTNVAFRFLQSPIIYSTVSIKCIMYIFSAFLPFNSHFVLFMTCAPPNIHHNT